VVLRYVGEFRTGGAISVFPSLHPSFLLSGNINIPCLTAMRCTVLKLRIEEVLISNLCVFKM
jgi:hypothetical protein